MDKTPKPKTVRQNPRQGHSIQPTQAKIEYDVPNKWHQTAYPSKSKQFTRFIFISTLLVLIGFSFSTLIWFSAFSNLPKEALINYNEILVSEPEPVKIENFIDYASAYNGGKILSTLTSPPYHGILPLNKAEFVINGQMDPGDCWAIDGHYGYVTIQLSEVIQIEKVSIQHQNKITTLNAPKNFSVYISDTQKAVPIGNYEFKLHNNSPKQEWGQIYDCKENCSVWTNEITLVIYSNYGADNTCVYEFLVHGRPSTYEQFK